MSHLHDPNNKTLILLSHFKNVFCTVYITSATTIFIECIVPNINIKYTKH